MTRVLVPRHVSCHSLHSDPCTGSWLWHLYAAVRLLAIQTARLGLHSQLLPWYVHSSERATGMLSCTCKVCNAAHMQSCHVVPMLQQAQHRFLPQSQLQGHQLQPPPSVNLHHQWDEPCLLQHQTTVESSNHTYK